MNKNRMLTLGIETSCDETACAVLEGRDIVRSNIVSSSLNRHRPFGGVVPEIASRHCLEQIDVVFHEALKRAGVKAEKLDLIAVTQGPGLIGSLLVGVCFAKALSQRLEIPLVPVNHLEAHLEAPFISNQGRFIPVEEAKKPKKFIGLLVSGGHTSLSYHAGRRVTLLGETVDDAVGEAYDKVAKILGLGYPGGPILDKLAKEGDPQAISFTRPKQDNPYDFSFSGIKTAVLYYIRKHPLEKMSAEEVARIRRNIAASFQYAVIGWIVDKTIAAVCHKKTKAVVVGGGVSANSLLRSMLAEKAAQVDIRVYFPHLLLTIDNAAMVARRGFEIFKKSSQSSLRLSGDADLSMRHRRL